MNTMSMGKGKILIIDDEQDIRDVLRLHLEQGGFHVLEATNGEEAIKIMREGANMVNVGLILCDIRMPKVNGVEAIEFFLRENRSIPLLVITGYPDSELAVSLIKKGVKDYLVKPVEKENLLSKVRSIINDEQNFQYA